MQSLPLFSGVVVIISLGSVIVTIQAKLLGGRVSFLQALCVLGYCVAPLDAAALVACFTSTIWIRVPVVLGAWGWCVWGPCSLCFVREEDDLMRRVGAFYLVASVNFLDGTKIDPTRILLAVYPILCVLVLHPSRSSRLRFISSSQTPSRTGYSTLFSHG